MFLFLVHSVLCSGHVCLLDANISLLHHAVYSDRKTMSTICLTVLIQHLRVIDERTDRQTDKHVEFLRDPMPLPTIRCF